MAYSATYEADDVAAVSIDVIVGVAVIIFNFATLIGLILVYRWFRGRKLMP